MRDATKRGMAAKAAAKLLPTAIVGCALSLAFARAASHALSFSPDLLQGLFLGYGSLAESVLADPFAIAWERGEVRAAAATGASLVAAGILLTASRGFKGNVDTGAEHGDDRLATPKEAASLCDRRRFENNLWFSQRSGLAIVGCDRRTKAAIKGRNLNSVCIGISGMGKTFNAVSVTLLQAPGDALAPTMSGKAAGALRAAGVLRDPAVPADRAGKVLAGPCHEGPTAGFDVFATDSKGTLPSLSGHLLEAAGFDVTWLNTVRPDLSDGYNPLVYVDAREVDSAEAGEISVEAECCGLSVSASKAAPSRWRSQDGIALHLWTEFETKSTPALGGADPGEGTEPASGFAREAAALEGFSYERTSVTVRIEAFNLGWEARPAETAIALGPKLVPLAYRAEDGDSVEFAQDGAVAWRPSPIPGKERGRRASSAFLEISCEIVPMTVPDGVQLASAVECMVINLSGTESAKGSENEGFWEQTKRLKFMELIAYMFEAYAPKWRNLSTMIDLLDLCEVSPSGGKSPFDLLMDEWETGLRWVPPEEGGTQRRAAAGRWERTEAGPHSAARSLAVHCHKAVGSGAEDTVRSILASCHAALVKIFPVEIRSILEKDDLRLDELGDPGRRKAVFVTTSDTDQTFDFLGALAYYQAVNLACRKADLEYGGTLPRHVRFELDEYRQLGNIPGSLRFFATVRSRNVSIGAYVQSIGQLDELHGEKGRETLFDCVSTWTFMGANSEKTLEFVSKAIGEETVYSRIKTRSFGDGGAAKGASEQIQGTSRRVRSPSKLRQTPLDTMYVFHYGLPAVEDRKFDTTDHPYFRWGWPGKRPRTRPKALFDEPFDFAAYKARRDARRKELGQGG